MLENGIKAILAGIDQLIKENRETAAKLKALEEKEKPSVKAKMVRK